MPLYDYRCSACQEITEIRHGFDAPNTDPCPQCGGTLLRVFNPAPIVFKGSGFYVTDSRKSESKPASKPAEKAGEKAAEKPATGDASSATPATAPAAAATPASASGSESAA